MTQLKSWSKDLMKFPIKKSKKIVIASTLCFNVDKFESSVKFLNQNFGPVDSSNIIHLLKQKRRYF